MRRFLCILFLVTVISHLSSNLVSAQTDWPMTAANPQRTSHNTVEVTGNLTPVWYRPIDPYIDTKVQVIAADNKIFVSTSKGLYAFAADNNGDLLWVYGTELPLGNSPTYSNGTLYVGGFDHQIHAINASDGQLKTGWTFVNAGAGYDTNPLVVSDSFTNNQPVVIAGNRDGYLYVLDGHTGTLKWKFKTDGPIHLSAAYKNGVVYFASDDAYAYAVNVANGTQVWRSGKFPGVGFDMYWPVIYTDTYPSSPTFGKDFIILAGSLKAGRWVCATGTDYAPYGCQIHSPNFEMYDGKPSCTATTSQAYLWASGTPTLSCDSIFDYYNNNPKWGNQKPWWRISYILDRTTGVEQTPYAPFNPSGFDGDSQGFKQPPVVGGDGALYQHIGYNNSGNGGCNGWIAGWKFGTKYISHIASESAACDEPTAFTSGGKYIYYGEGSFNHEGFGTINTNSTTPNDSKWTSSVSQMPGSTSKYTELRLWGKFGSASGAYSYMDGFVNHSPIPYNGKLYVINGNVLYALSGSGTATSPKATAQAPTQQAPASMPTTKTQLQQTLYDEVQKMLTAGHLRPGFHSSGLTSQWMNGAYNHPIPGDNLTQYFKGPSDTVITLVRVLDYINQHPEQAQLQTLVTPIKTYLQNNYGPGAPYSFTTYASIGWRNGAKREQYDDLPEFTSQIADDYDVNFSVANKPRACIWAMENLKIATPNTAECWLNDQAKSGFPPESLYAAWHYAKAFNYTPDQAEALFNSMKNKLSTPGVGNDMTNANLVKYPYLLNQYIIGYGGYLELAKLANISPSDLDLIAKTEIYNNLLILRRSNFSKDPIFSREENEFNGVLNAARNFMYLTPELAEWMRSNVLSQAQATVDQYQILTPNWFVSKFSQSGAESYSQPLYDYPALFQAKAYILQEPYEELIKYLDVPAFARGDLFYLQNLVAALDAPGDVFPPPVSPTGPIPLTGDLDHDNDVDFLDLLALIFNFNTGGPGNFNLTGLVDIFDFNSLVNLLTN